MELLNKRFSLYKAIYQGCRACLPDIVHLFIILNSPLVYNQALLGIANGYSMAGNEYLMEIIKSDNVLLPNFLPNYLKKIGNGK